MDKAAPMNASDNTTPHPHDGHKFESDRTVNALCKHCGAHFNQHSSSVCS